MNPLVPFGKLYGRVMDIRNRLYDRGILKNNDLGARTISVGNLTTGGTGKTPLVALIAEILIESGESVCILTRGYGRKTPRERVLVSNGSAVLTDAHTGGDEPVELAQKLNGKAIIVADADRVAAARWVRGRFDVTVFILDDGFQHRRARRDLDIVCIDATNPCDNGRILPAGSLRESISGIGRADVLVITRAEQVEDVSALTMRLRERNSSATIFKAKTELQGLVSIEEFAAEGEKPTNVQPELPFAFTGIGNPRNFFKTLERAGINVHFEFPLEDHFRYDQATINLIGSRADLEGSKSFVTTAKDAVKLKGLHFNRPCFVAIAATVIDEADEFRKLIISS